MSYCVFHLLLFRCEWLFSDQSFYCAVSQGVDSVWKTSHASSVYHGFLVFHKILLLQATKLRQGYVFTGVCDSVHWGERGVFVRETPWTEIPPGQRPPLDRDPLDRDPPGWRPPKTETPSRQRPRGHRPPQYGNKWVVRILLECILVIFCTHLVFAQQRKCIVDFPSMGFLSS